MAYCKVLAIVILMTAVICNVSSHCGKGGKGGKGMSMECKGKKVDWSPLKKAMEKCKEEHGGGKDKKCEMKICIMKDMGILDSNGHFDSGMCRQHIAQMFPAEAVDEVTAIYIKYYDGKSEQDICNVNHKDVMKDIGEVCGWKGGKGGKGKRGKGKGKQSTDYDDQQ